MNKSDEELWVKYQEKITKHLMEVLQKIEWYYGDNRAPFRYPPRFETIVEANNQVKYLCILEEDFGEDA